MGPLAQLVAAEAEIAVEAPGFAGGPAAVAHAGFGVINQEKLRNTRKKRRNLKKKLRNKEENTRKTKKH